VWKAPIRSRIHRYAGVIPRRDLPPRASSPSGKVLATLNVGLIRNPWELIAKVPKGYGLFAI